MGLKPDTGGKSFFHILTGTGTSHSFTYWLLFLICSATSSVHLLVVFSRILHSGIDVSIHSFVGSFVLSRIHFVITFAPIWSASTH